MLYLAVFFGGGLGSIARYGISKFVAETFSTNFPLGTLIANVLATAILGFIMYYAAERYAISAPLKLLLTTGFCGGFSTFSTFSYETIELFRIGNYIYAIANILISLTLSIIILLIIVKTPIFHKI